MRYFASLLSAASLFFALAASAETYYLEDHPGWQAFGSPATTLTFTRADRSIAGMSITAYPADAAPIASEAQALSRTNEVVAEVVENYPSSCAGLAGVEPKPNGMGLEVSSDDDEPSCIVFVSLTPDKKLFANLWVHNDGLARKSFAYQKTAALWLDLAVKRIQGEAIVPTDDEPADLQAIAERVARDHGPVEMLHMRQTNHPFSHAAVPVVEGEPLTNCLNWDPAAYAPRDLLIVGGSGQPLFNLGACSIFAWKRDSDSGEINAFLDGDWRSLEKFGEAIYFDQVSNERILPFEPGERINFLGGDKKRLFNLHYGASLSDLRPADAWFTPDGRYTSGGFGLENKSVELIAQSNGRYYLQGHIAVFERDDGPILIALAGKTMKNGEIDRIFIGERTFKISDEFRELINR